MVDVNFAYTRMLQFVRVCALDFKALVTPVLCKIYFQFGNVYEHMLSRFMTVLVQSALLRWLQVL